MYTIPGFTFPTGEDCTTRRQIHEKARFYKNGVIEMARMNKENIAFHILTSKSLNEAAEKSGVSVSALYRMRKRPDFQKVFDEVKNNLFQDTMNKAQVYSLNMLEVLKTIAYDKTATDSSRVSAARTVLELGLQSRNTEIVQNEVRELKRMMEDEGS